MLTTMLSSSLGTRNKEGTHQAKSLTSEFIVQLEETNDKFKYDRSGGNSAVEKN